MAKTLYKFTADLKHLENLQRLLKEANKELKNMQSSTTASKKGIDKQASATKQLNTQLEATKNKARQVTTAANQVAGAGRSMTNVFKSAAVAIAAAFAVRAISGGIRGMINVFREFEARMAAVKAISGATNEEFVQLEKSALELGRTTIFSAAQIAKLQEEYARLGFTTEEILKAQEATVALAAATGEDLGNAAATAGSVLRAFTYDANQTARIVDVMAESFTGSALNLERFTQSMKFVAPIAKNVGFTIEETTAMMMKLADAGLHGSIAGNALKNIFLKLGDAGSDLSKHLGGPVNSLDDLVEHLQRLKEDAFGATQAAELLEKRATPAFITLIDQADGLAELRDQLVLADGAAREMASIRLNTLEGDLILMQSAMEGLGIALSDTFDITLRQTVESFTSFLQSFAESEGALKVFRQTLQFLVGGFTLLITRLALLKIGTIGYTIYLKLKTAAMAVARITTALYYGGINAATVSLTRMTATTKGATLATRTFNAAMAATPWGMLFFLVGGAIALFSSWGDEMDEETLRLERLKTAFEEQQEAVMGTTFGSKEYREELQKLNEMFPEVFANYDILIANQKEVIKLTADVAFARSANGKLIAEEIEQLEKQTKQYELQDAVQRNYLENVFEYMKNMENFPWASFGMNMRTLFPDGKTITKDMSVMIEELSKFEEAFNTAIFRGKSPGSKGTIESAKHDFVHQFAIDNADLMDLAFDEVIQKIKGGKAGGPTFDIEFFELMVQPGMFDPSTLWEFKTFLPKIQDVTKPQDKWLSDFQGSIDDLIAALESKKAELLQQIEQGIGDVASGSLVVSEESDKYYAKLRDLYLEDLEDYRDTGIEKQKILLTEAEEKLATLTLWAEYYHIEATQSTAAAEVFMERQKDKGKALTDFLTDYKLESVKLGFADKELNATIGVQVAELIRHIEDLQNNMNKSQDEITKHKSKSQKFRLEKTKDYYKDLLKLQADFHQDELRSEQAQADAKLKFKEKDILQQVKMNYANVAEIERIRGELRAGIDAGEFINTTSIIKQFDILKSFSKETLKDFLNIGAKGGDKLRGQTTEIIAEIVTVGENGELVIEEVAMTLTDVLDKMIEEEKNKMSVNIQFMGMLADDFDRKMERLSQKRRDKNAQDQTDYFQALVDQEMQIGKVLNEDKGMLSGTNRWSRQRDVMDIAFNHEIKRINENHKMKDKFSREDEKRLIIAAKKAGATQAEITEIEEGFTRERDKLRQDSNTERINAETEYAESVEASIRDQIEAYADVYNQLFDMFSMMQTNKLDMQMQRDQQYHDNKTKALAAELERELELVGDNQEAQNNLRELYAARQETADEQLEKKQQDIARKRFRTEKANSIVQALINGALAMTKISAQTGVATFVFSPMIAALVAAQIAVIASQQFVGALGGLIPKFAKGGMVHGPSHAQGGVKFNAGGRVVELEGGEAVINKRSTSMFHNQLSAMNQAGGGKSFASGGIMPGTSNMISGVGGGMNMEAFAHNIVKGINSKKITVTEADISSTQNNVAVVEATASLF